MFNMLEQCDFFCTPVETMRTRLMYFDLIYLRTK